MGMKANPAHMLSPDLAKIIEQQELIIEREYENEHPHYYEERFSNIPLSRTDNPRIQKIIDGIKELELPLKLYSGTAKVRKWVGHKLSQKVEMTHDQWKIANDEGHSLRFNLDELSAPVPGAENSECRDMGRIHTVLYEVKEDRQGSFFKSKRFLINQLKTLLLEHCGFTAIWGRARWSVNTYTRGRPSKDQDWRTQWKCVGVAESLKPIFLNKLYLFYMRLGFIADIDEAIDVHEGRLDPQAARTVYLLSDKASKEIREELGDAAWIELNKYNQNNLKDWNDIQRERNKRINPIKLDKIKRATLIELKKRQEILDKQ